MIELIIGSFYLDEIVGSQYIFDEQFRGRLIIIFFLEFFILCACLVKMIRNGFE